MPGRWAAIVHDRLMAAPAMTTLATRRIIAGRAIRGFVDGLVSVSLAIYLLSLGFSKAQIGAIVTGTLLGSAALTLLVGLAAHRVAVRTVLLGSCALMCATGIGFAATSTFVPILLVAVVGTLNPSGGDVSVFLPTEQGFLANEVSAEGRPRLFARYNLGGTLAGALGALASGSRYLGGRSGFVLYAIAAVVIAAIYLQLPAERAAGADRRPLQKSRAVVLRLAALFSLDSAASGLTVTALLVLWLHLRFDLSRQVTAGVFFAAGLLGAASQLLAGRLVARIGLIRTMVFTHLPANGLLILAAFAPWSWLAIGLLLLRALFAQMDVPARQAFVMAVVPPEERAAAAGVTNVPRSLASATTPFIAGILLQHSHFGWPLVIAGAMKIVYDLTLLVMFRDVPEEFVG